MTMNEKLRKIIGPCFYFDGGDGADGGGGTGGDDGGTPPPAGDEGASGDFNFNEFKSNYGGEYADKPYMKDIDSPQKLFKEFDNAVGLIGKKLNIPGAEATEKEHNEYLELIRPKDKSVYKFQDGGLPENLKGLHPEGFEDSVKDIFQKASLTPRQADIVQDEYNKLLMGLHGKALEDLAEKENARITADADFEALADKTWGQERENVQSVAKTLLQQFVPAEFKGHVDSLSNENLIIMASVLKGVSDKYISQDDLIALKGSVAGAMGADALRAEAQKEMSKLLTMSEFDKEYDNQQKKVDDLYARLGKVSGDK